jgi:hypothetical protein
MKTYRYEIIEDEKVLERITCDNKEALKKAMAIIEPYEPRDPTVSDVIRNAIKIRNPEEFPHKHIDPFKEKEEFKPTEEQKARWSKEPVSEGQIKYLEKLGYDGETKEMTKLEANQLIDNLKEKKRQQESAYL